jgi:hypothetical protein
VQLRGRLSAPGCHKHDNVPAECPSVHVAAPLPGRWSPLQASGGRNAAGPSHPRILHYRGTGKRNAVPGMNGNRTRTALRVRQSVCLIDGLINTFLRNLMLWVVAKSCRRVAVPVEYTEICVRFCFRNWLFPESSGFFRYVGSPHLASYQTGECCLRHYRAHTKLIGPRCLRRHSLRARDARGKLSADAEYRRNNSGTFRYSTKVFLKWRPLTRCSALLQTTGITLEAKYLLQVNMLLRANANIG